MENGTLTIRRLDQGLKRKLRMRAAEHGRSMEEEAREILRAALTSASSGNLVDSIRSRVAATGYLTIELPVRGPMRKPPDFK
jgi:plasmid stability protein